MLLSASALGGFVECEHRAWLDRQAALGHVAAPATDAGSALLWEKGREHERAWLDALVAGGAEVTVIEGASRDPGAAAAATLAAMRRGMPFIYQGAFVDDGFGSGGVVFALVLAACLLAVGLAQVVLGKRPAKPGRRRSTHAERSAAIQGRKL